MFASGAIIYGYVNGNPVNLADPSGNCPWCLAGAIIGATANTGFQLYRNGGDLSQIDIQQVGLAAAGGMLGGGLGTVTAALELGTASNIITNALGSGLISGAQQIANNALHGECAMKDVESSALKGAAFGGLGAGVGIATNKFVGYMYQNAFNNLTLAERTLSLSNAISGPYFPPGTPNWAIGGTVAGNIASNVTANMNQ